jgi:hypothetical protein
MDKVQKHNSFNTNIPSPESHKNYLQNTIDYTPYYTPWCRILFEKLIVTQLIKKYPAFLRNAKVHQRVNKSPPLDPSILMLSSHLRLGLPSGLLPSGLPIKKNTID